MLLRIISFGIGLCYASYASAMFCPGNLNQINLGDSFAFVAAQCGTPAAQKNTKEEDTSIPQEWTYYVTMPTDPQQSYGSVRIVMAFVGGQVINITSGGYSVGATSLCNGTSIQVGSTMKQVTAACGKAVMVNKAAPQPGAEKNPGNEIVEWKYNSTPPVTLKFTNGKLTSRE